MTTLTEKQIENIGKALAADGGMIAAFLLGSAARGEMRNDSDVDIAVLTKDRRRLSAFEKVELAVELGRICGRDVDVGVLDTRNLVYAREAYLTGRCVYCSDIFQRDMFGATALGLYAELKENRKEVEDAYRCR